jgi:hypothetical protein
MKKRKRVKQIWIITYGKIMLKKMPRVDPIKTVGSITVVIV